MERKKREGENKRRRVEGKEREVKTVARQHTTSVRLQQLIQFSGFSLQGYSRQITLQAL